MLTGNHDKELEIWYDEDGHVFPADLHTVILLISPSNSFREKSSFRVNHSLIQKVEPHIVEVEPRRCTSSDQLWHVAEKTGWKFTFEVYNTKPTCTEWHWLGSNLLKIGTESFSVSLTDCVWVFSTFTPMFSRIIIWTARNRTGKLLEGCSLSCSTSFRLLSLSAEHRTVVRPHP